MGMRAVAQITTPASTAAFYAQWGSPAYKLPALADWIESHTKADTIPSAVDYLEETKASGLDHFTEPHTASHLPSDLDWTYELTISAHEPQGRLLPEPFWFGRLTIHGPRQWRPEPARLPRAHVIRFDASDLSEFGPVIATLATEHLANIDRHGLATRDEHDWWTALAERWTAPA